MKIAAFSPASFHDFNPSFNRSHAAWQDPSGEFRLLHDLNPLRIRFVLDQIASPTSQNENAPHKLLAGLHITDLGCGGGLLTEPLSRLGAHVIGVDSAENPLDGARLSAQAQNLNIIYKCADLRDFLACSRAFSDLQGSQDLVTAMEVAEHLDDPIILFKLAAFLLRPGGLFILSTLNRTTRSFGLGIVFAEYIARWVPRGTHAWSSFLTPSEISWMGDFTGFSASTFKGLTFRPLEGIWTLSDDLSVNYITALRNE